MQPQYRIAEFVQLPWTVNPVSIKSSSLQAHHHQQHISSDESQLHAHCTHEQCMIPADIDTSLCVLSACSVTF